MAAKVIANLTYEDLAKWRVLAARLLAIKRKPGAYMRDEIERTYMEQMQLAGSFVEKYQIPNVGWSLHAWTGLIEEDA